MERLTSAVLTITALLICLLAIPSAWNDPMGLGAVSATLFAALSATLLAAAWGTWRDRAWGWLVAALAGFAGLVGAYAIAEATARGGPLDPDDWLWVAVFGIGGALALAGSTGRLVRRARQGSRGEPRAGDQE